MPTMVADTAGDLHIAWYDTRNDLQSPGDRVKISLYYAKVRETNGNLSVLTEELLIEEAIDTDFLSNPLFIGDAIDITMTTDDSHVVIVFTATAHPIQQGGGGFQGQGGPTSPLPTNECIAYFVLTKD